MRSIKCSLALGVLASAVSTFAFAGDPLPPPASADPKNYENLTQAVLDCPSVQGSPLVGVIGCEDFGGRPGFRRKVVELALARAKKTEELRYDGKEMLDWASAETKNAYAPVCNVSAGEIETNRRGQSCGKLCYFDVHGVVDVSTRTRSPYCEREKAWYAGADVQISKFYALQVLQEFKNHGRITLSKLYDYENGQALQPGHLACHPMAADLMSVQRDELNGTLDAIIKKYGKEHAATLRCNRDKSTVSMMAPCNLEMIQTRLATFWTRVISCEAFVRAHNEKGKMLSTPEALQDRAQAALEPKCRGKYNADCKACWNSTRERKLNSCYKNEMPPFMIHEFRKYETKELEKELGGHASNSPGFGFVFAIGALLGGRKPRQVSRRRRQGARGLIMAALAILLAALTLLAGCASADAPDDSGQVCDPGQDFDEVAKKCIDATDDPEESQADFVGAGGDLGGMQADAQTAREEMGIEDIKAPPKPQAGHDESLAATAEDKLTNNKLTPFTPGGGKGGTSGGGGVAPEVAKVKGGAGKDVAAESANLGSGVGLAATAEQAAEKPVATADVEPGRTFEDGSGGGGKNSGSDGAGGFSGFGESGPTAAGAAAEGYGNGNADAFGGGGSMESYLEKVGRTSLFEIVNKRTEKFTVQLDAHAATGEFHDLAR